MRGHVRGHPQAAQPDMAELFIDYAVNGCTPHQLAQKNGLTILLRLDAAEPLQAAAARASGILLSFFADCVRETAAIPSKEVEEP